MKNNWSHHKIQNYIDNQIQESLTLEYKSAAALGRYEEQKKEITKDVSAFANSAGGILIYGICEYQAPEKEHLPERIDPIDQTVITKEWLENIINNIQPRIDALKIIPVQLNESKNLCVYVIEIPKSSTAHQAVDQKYYKRYNFQNLPMDDHEVRDVMGRENKPKVNLSFTITKKIQKGHSLGLNPQTAIITNYNLLVHGKNIGNLYAQYISYFLYVPEFIVHEFDKRFYKYTTINSERFAIIKGKNTVRDYLGSGGSPLLSIEKYGPSRYEPLLPGLTLNLDDHALTDDFEELNFTDERIIWKVHADNATPNSGEILIHRINTKVG